MRRLLLIPLILNGLLLPLGCIPLALIANTVNPMQSVFITDFVVTNALAEPIRVTPIGASGAEGRRSLLPLFRSRFPAVMSVQSGDFLVEPGQTIELLYDSDDIIFSELVIRFPDGTMRQLVVNDSPTENRYRPPQVNTFTINEQTVLEDAPDHVRAAASRAGAPSASTWIVLILLLPWATFYLLFRAHSRVRLRGHES